MDLKVLANRFLRNIGIKKEVKHIPVTSTETSQVVHALTIENADLKGRLGKAESTIASFRKAKKDLNEEELVKQVLNDKYMDLKAGQSVKYLSLRELFGHLLYGTKYGQSLNFTTWNRSKNLGKVYDIGITPGKSIIFLSESGKPLWQSRNIGDAFFSPESLINDAKYGTIPLPLDEQGDYIENIMAYESAEILNTGENLTYAKASKKPVYEVIKSLNEDIHMRDVEIQNNEVVIKAHIKRINELEGALRVRESMAETTNADKALVLQRTSEIYKMAGEMQRELQDLRTTTASQEEEIESMEGTVESLREKAEREAQTTSDEKSLERINEIRETLSKTDERMKLLAIKAQEDKEAKAIPSQPQ